MWNLKFGGKQAHFKGTKENAHPVVDRSTVLHMKLNHCKKIYLIWTSGSYVDFIAI